VGGLVAPIRLAIARIGQQAQVWRPSAKVVEEAAHRGDGTGRC
jgi:hypothetical protein